MKDNYVDNPFDSPAVLSLCTGLLGGIERGIEAALETPIRPVAYVEIEAVAVDNILQGIEKGFLGQAPIWTNLKTFPYRPFHGKVHGITGGYPCQPFSAAGNRDGDKDPRHLWPFIRRIVESIKPVWCFFENVEGHLSLGFEEVSRDLRKMGYRVEAGIYSAEEIGAGHRRKRLFILAIRMGYTGCAWGQRGQSNGLDKRGWKVGDSQELRTASRSGPINSSEEMDNASGLRYESEYKISAGRNSIINAGEALAYSNHQGLQGRHSGELQKCGRECTARTSSAFKGFPAPPQHEQFDYEPPRIESSMGYTINGYNFREDLLRGIGNGVVWQTAELAFKSLLIKHGINLPCTT